jgi:anaerobic dimethyl sulfoxide reductase subunit B (iron-sulfur subunit)
MQYGFHFDGTRCTGCRTCVIACKDYNDIALEYAYRQVYEYVGGSWAQDAKGAWTNDTFVYFVSQSCNHCDEAACIRVCPTGAMNKDPKTGLVNVNTDRCIGCGYCHLSCPYNAPKVDREKGHSVKCTGCVNRVQEGKLPICIEGCGLRALDFGPIEELKAKYGEVMAIAPLPDASFTKPNFVITPPVDAKPVGYADGVLGNRLEIV